MQIYLPEDLYAKVKQRGLAASELLQVAIRAELQRQALLGEGDRYLAELIEEVGMPTAEEVARAAAVVREFEGNEGATG